jgi:hypothetical protein
MSVGVAGILNRAHPLHAEQVHYSTVLTPEKSLPLRIGRKAGWAGSLSRSGSGD